MKKRYNQIKKLNKIGIKKCCRKAKKKRSERRRGKET